MSAAQSLSSLLWLLTQRARAVGLNDTEWARRANVRKETLSRLRSRETCDLATLHSLAQVVGARIGVVDAHSETTEDGHYPLKVNREFEEQLLQLCASRNVDPLRWRIMGPPVFMAGLAVMVANMANADRAQLLTLAEELHPGSTKPEVFSLWLRRSPVRPSRFLSLLAGPAQHAA